MMETITQSAINGWLQYRNESQGAPFPEWYNNNYDRRNPWPDITEENWPSYSWSNQPDEKPSWEELIVELKRLEGRRQILTAQYEITGRSYAYQRERVKHSSGVFLEGVHQVRVSAIQEMLALAELNPRQWKPVRLQHHDGNGFLDLHTMDEAREYIDVILDRHNKSYNLQHSMVKELHDLLEAALRPDATETEKKAFQEAVDGGTAADNFDLRITMAPPKLSEPSLEDVKKQARNELDAAAAAHRRFILDVDTNQGAALPASCGEQEDALRELSRVLQLAKRNVDGADDEAMVRDHLAIGTSHIAQVTVTGAPTWGNLPTKPQDFTIGTNNQGQVELGSLIATGPQENGSLSYVVAQSGWALRRPEGEFVLIYRATSRPEQGPHILNLIARNNCGPALYNLEVHIGHGP